MEEDPRSGNISRTAAISVVIAFYLIFLMDFAYYAYNPPFENLLYTINQEKHGEFVEKLWREIKKEAQLAADEKLPNVYIKDNDLRYSMLGRYSPDPEAIVVYYDMCRYASRMEGFSKKESEINFYNVLAHELFHYALARKGITVDRHHCLMLENRHIDKISNYIDSYFKNKSPRVKAVNLRQLFSIYLFQGCAHNRDQNKTAR